MFDTVDRISGLLWHPVLFTGYPTKLGIFSLWNSGILSDFNAEKKKLIMERNVCKLDLDPHSFQNLRSGSIFLLKILIRINISSRNPRSESPFLQEILDPDPHSFKKSQIQINIPLRNPRYGSIFLLTTRFGSTFLPEILDSDPHNFQKSESGST